MNEEFKNYMQQLVSVDIDLKPIKRWQYEAILIPDMGVALARIYGTKEEIAFYKKLAKEAKEKAGTNEHR